MGRPTVLVNVTEVKVSTDKALLCVVDGEEVWIPRSQIVEGDLEDKGDSGEIEIPEWLATEKGIA